MRSTTLNLVLLTLLAAGVVYASIDAWLGPSGGMHRGALRAEIRELKREIADLRGESARLEAKTVRLSGQVVDRELLDERLRAVFGVAHADEMLLIEPRRPLSGR